MRVLPFAVYSEPAIAYPEAIEAAVALLAIEGRRSKGTGLLQRKTEQIAWISRFAWPLAALPVDLPASDGETAAGGLSAPARKLLFFDLTGLAGSSIAPFAPREGLDVATDPAIGDLPVTDFTAVLERVRDSLRQAKPTLASALSTVRGLVRRGPSGSEIAGFLSGHAQLAKELLKHLADEPEAPEWTGAPIASSLTLADAERIAADVADLVRAHLGQAAQLEEAARQLREKADAHPPRLAEERSRITADYQGQIDALRPEVDRAIAEYQRALEEQINAITAQYSSTIAAQEAELSRLAQSEDRQPAAAARRALDSSARERDNAVNQARDHFRSLIDKENEKVGNLTRARDREIGVLDAAERKLASTLADMERAAEAAAVADRKAAADLSAMALEPADPALSDGGAVEFALPLYIARIDGPKTRYTAFLPVTLKRAPTIQAKVGGLISGLIGGGVSLPSEGRYEAVLGRSLNAVLEAAETSSAGSGVFTSILEGAAGANVLANEEFHSLAMTGLASLREANWLNDKQYEEQREALTRLFGL